MPSGFVGTRRTMLSAKKVATVTVPTTTWDSSFNSANLTFSNTLGSPLTVKNTAASGFQLARSVASHSSGKYYAEFHVDSATGSYYFGICNSSESSGFSPGPFDNNGIGVNAADGQVWLNGANPTGSPISTFATGNTISMAVDMGNKLIWWRVGSGNWNNVSGGDPTNSSTGHGISFSTIASGPWFACWSGQTAGSDQATANFGGSAYAQSEPSGYGNW